MSSLKDYEGVISHHLKLITDSNISTTALHSLHSSGFFSTLLRCEEPYRVNREALADLLKVREKRSIQKIRALASRKLAQAARARETRNLGGRHNWLERMEETSELLRAIYRQIGRGWKTAARAVRDFAKLLTKESRSAPPQSGGALLSARGQKLEGVGGGNFLPARQGRQKLKFCHSILELKLLNNQVFNTPPC